MKDLIVLLDAIHQPFSRREYQPKNGLTFCNQFIDEVCELYGFKEFRGKLANTICEILENHPQWSEIPMESAQGMANAGSLVLAALKAEPHGHVCVVCPGVEKSSWRWGKVPSVASVGIENMIGRGINWAFGAKPKLYVWKQTI